MIPDSQELIKTKWKLFFTKSTDVVVRHNQNPSFYNMNPEVVECSLCSIINYAIEGVVQGGPERMQRL